MGERERCPKSGNIHYRQTVLRFTTRKLTNAQQGAHWRQINWNNSDGSECLAKAWEVTVRTVRRSQEACRIDRLFAATGGIIFCVPFESNRGSLPETKDQLKHPQNDWRHVAIRMQKGIKAWPRDLWPMSVRKKRKLLLGKETIMKWQHCGWQGQYKLLTHTHTPS